MATSVPPASPTSRFDELVAAANPSSNRDPAGSERAAHELREAALLADDDTLALEAAVWVCIHLLRRGELRQAVDESHAVRSRLRSERPGSRLGAARMELLRTIALAASETGDFATALDAAQELAGDPAVHADASTAFDAAFSLAVCLERMGDSWQAMRILNGAIDRHGDAAPSFPMLYALNGVVATAIGAFHRTSDETEPSEAAELLETARAAAERALVLLDEFENPIYRVAVGGNLGEVLAYQGDLDAADTLLRSALSAAEDIGAGAHRDRVRASIGEWLMLSDRPDEALTILEELIAELGDDGPHSTRIRAHHAAYRSARALCQFELALEHLEIYERLERHRTTGQLRSQSEMFITKSEARTEAERHRSTAERDPLTGLGNRRNLNRVLQHLLPRADATHPVALAMIDVDHFKSINDELGHATGDSVLIELAHVLRDEVRDDDVIVRYGGEEVVIVMPGASVDDAAARCGQLRERVERHVWPGLPADRRITLSIGIAGTPPCEPELVVSAADRAMYHAKRDGRNLVRIASAEDVRDATPMAIPRP
jgi:diguanylate cyclase (GGDEF)-like protein